MEILIYHPSLRIPTEVDKEAMLVESLGYSGMVMPDHLYVLDFQTGSPLPYPHPLAVLSAAAAVTKRIKLLSLVSNNLARGPVELAHQTATLANLAPGRVELAIGAGWFAEEHISAGVKFPTGGERIERLTETVAICRALFANAQVQHDGNYYKVNIPIGGFTPVSSNIPILVGAAAPRMIRAAAQIADRVDLQPNALSGGGADLNAYNSYTFELLAAGVEQVQKAAQAVGRKVKVSASPFVLSTTSETEADLARKSMADFVGLPLNVIEDSFGTLIGTFDQIREKVKRYTTAGCDRIHLQALNPEAAEQLAPMLSEFLTL